jgi:hypothetical protein
MANAVSYTDMYNFSLKCITYFVSCALTVVLKVSDLLLKAAKATFIGPNFMNPWSFFFRLRGT